MIKSTCWNPFYEFGRLKTKGTDILLLLLSGVKSPTTLHSHGRTGVIKSIPRIRNFQSVKFINTEKGKQLITL